MVDGDVEETLNLLSMKIDRKNAICARRDQQISHELRSNWYARLIFAILSSVAIERNYGGMRLAEARRAASIMIKSSIKF